MTGVAIAIALGGCAASAPVTCEEVERDPPAPLSCEVAVSAARSQLAAVPGITALRFQYDECAPNAPRCAFLFGTAGNVIASLSDGRELAVFVGMDPQGIVQAQGLRSFAPESRPTPLP